MRQLDPTFAAALQAGIIMPGILADLTFASGVEYVWTGFGEITWNGNTYRGVGTLAGMGDIQEGISVRADGTSVSLDGIDPKLYAEFMSEIQVGAPATLWFALLTINTQVIVDAYQLFSGLVDKPTVTTGADKISITLALETRLTNLQRASNRRLTSADQRIDYPTDIGLGWVETLQDQAFYAGVR